MTIKQVINENANGEVGKFSGDRDGAQEDAKQEHVDAPWACLRSVTI